MFIPFKYLGLQVGGNSRKKIYRKGVIEKVSKKLCKWKGKHLSFTRRVFLIKSMFTTIPLYYLSLFKAPSLVCREMRSLQRKILWGGKVKEGKLLG